MDYHLIATQLEHHAYTAGKALAILVIGWIIAGWIAGAVRRAMERSGRVSQTLLPLLYKITRIVLLAIVVVAALDKVGVNTSGLFAMLGAAGLAVGLALKDTVSDVAAGVVLLILRPFDVGEGVDIGGTSGVITEIGLFQTSLLSFDGIPITINNSAVRTATIQNFARAQTRRADLEIGIGYSDDIGLAKAAIAAVLQADERVLQDPAPLIDTLQLGDSAVVLLVRYHTTAADFFVTKLEMTRQIKERLDREGISIPFPQRDIHLLKSEVA